MKISSSDFLLLRFCDLFQRPLRWASELETNLLAGKLESIAITRPVFISGLARSGSTILLQLLASIEGVATHRYGDFPLLAVPYLWNRYLSKPPIAEQPAERAHKDRIQITRSSPEAMEEPLWRAWIPQLRSPVAATDRLTAADQFRAFEQFHRDHLKKILLVRSGQRYIAKNNYHVTRIEYLLRLYPDAEFIVPIRHPLTHVESLVRQHRLFCEYARQEPRVPQYMAAAGHFEFGPQRRPIRLSPSEGERTIERWREGDEHGGYGIQWKEVYGFIRDLRRSNERLAQRIHVVRYEDFCSAPQQQFAALLQQVGLDSPGQASLPALRDISESPHATSLDAAQQRTLWQEVGPVAEHFGYLP